MDLSVPCPPPPPPPVAGNYTPTVSSLQSHVDSDLITSSELIDAIKAQDISKVQNLLEKGGDVNESTIFGTPLSVAVRANNLQLVQVLSSHAKCNVNARDLDGETPFCLSLRKHCSDISIYLLSKGCSINCLDPVTNISLLATAVEQKSLKIVEAMLAQGCEVDIRDTNNLTPLAHACLLSERVSEDGCDLALKAQLITVLYKAGADVNANVGALSNSYLIHEIILRRCYHALHTLLELNKDAYSTDNKLDIDRQNPIEKNTALNLAVALCDKRSVQMLLSYGAKINISNVFCDSPLSKALNDRLYDQSEVISLLLKYGADPNYEDVSHSKRRKGQCKPLFAAIENGNKDLVEKLLEHGADLSSLNYKGNCAIMSCLANGLSISLLHYIVDMMDELQIAYDISSWEYLRTAFPWTKHLQYLIDRGLDINARTSQGHKIIHINVVKFHPDSLEILLKNGLDPDSLSADGNTLLASCAGLSKYWQPIQMLVQYGANINIVYASDNEEDRLTPLQRSFAMEYDGEMITESDISQFTYFLNCGAFLTKEMCLWRDAFVADRIAASVSEDNESDSDSSTESTNSLSDHRNRLLANLELAFTPLPLKMYCRNIIRSAIIHANSSSQVKRIVGVLPLPNSVKEFVAFINVPTTRIIR